MRARPADVVQATIQVFENVDVPVAHYDPADGTVESGPFDPRQRWGAPGLQGRVTWGTDEHGEPRTRRGALTLAIDLEAESSLRRSGEPINFWSTVRIRSHGSLASGDEDGSHTCGLTTEHGNRLFDLIQRRAERYTG